MPTSQKFRPIAIDCDGNMVTLLLRPEDLQWSEPSRTTVSNTLGSAWIDSFGPGVATITIAGNTGWSGRQGLVEGDQDWLERFDDLYKVAFTEWHAKVEASRDPESVVMLFIDALDDRVVRVVPQTFVLRRNKQRPLLMQYTISFLVVRDTGSDASASEMMADTEERLRAAAEEAALEPDFIGPFGNGGPNALQQLQMMRNMVNQIQGWITTGQQIAKGNIGALVGVIGEVFGPVVAAAIDAVLGTVQTGLTIANQLGAGGSPSAPYAKALPVATAAGVALTAAAGASAITQLLGNTAPPGSAPGAPGSPPTLSSVERATLMQAAAALREISTLFTLGFRSPPSYQTYAPVYGAAGASAIAGGSPASAWGQDNPFEQILPVATDNTQQTVTAIRSARLLAQAEYVTADPMPPSAIAEYCSAVVHGTAFTA